MSTLQRTYGTVLLEKLVNQPSQVDSDLAEYKIDIDYYNKTGEIRKLGNAKTTPIIDSLAAEKKLRKEITTLEQFEKIGDYKTVAKVYSVSSDVANGLRLSLIPSQKKVKDKTKAQIMREELTTLAKFESVGSDGDVAKKYNIGKTSANMWHAKLRKEEGEKKMETMSEQRTSTQSEVENFFMDAKPNVLPKVELDEEAKSSSRSNEDCSGEVRNEYVGDCAKVNLEGVETADSFMRIFGFSRVADANPETVDDLQGLVEPEPTWNPALEETKTILKGYDKYLDRLLKEVKKPIDDEKLQDEEIWSFIFEGIQELRDRTIKRAIRDFENNVRDKFHSQLTTIDLRR
jgi:hypothetical protein